MKLYSEMIKLKSFEDRAEYLKLFGTIGEDIFGHNRYLNQQFYRSKKWRRVRSAIIVRDDGCDLGIDGREINGPVFVHHINTITIDDIINDSDSLYDPQNLISSAERTHKYIHFGTELLDETLVERTRNDTIPWRN